MLVAVTAPLPGVTVAFQAETMLCPDGRVNASFQPLIALLPVLVMVICSVSPLFHALTTSLTRQPEPVGGGDDGGAVVGGAVVGGAVVGGGEEELPPSAARTELKDGL